MILWIVGYRFFREFPAVDGLIASEDDFKAAVTAGKAITFKLVEKTPGTVLSTVPFPLGSPADAAAYGVLKTSLDADAKTLTNTSEKWLQYGNARIFIDVLDMDTGVLTHFQRSFPEDGELANNYAEAQAAGYV